MASEVAIALKRNDAQNRVEDATKRISDKLNISPFQRPLKAKDLAIREQQWYEAIASYLEKVADTLPELSSDLPNDPLMDFSKITKEDLINFHPELGLSDDMSKEEMIKAIEDAITDRLQRAEPIALRLEEILQQSADTSTDNEALTDAEQSVDDEHTSTHLLDYSKITKKDLIDLYPELGLSDSMSKAEMIKAIEDATADG